MSRYLEEAAQILRQIDKDVSNYRYEDRMAIAQGFATLAAIDKGLLPAELTADILARITEGATK